MAKALYMDDCYLQEFEAEVKSITEDKFVVLDQTAFYPKGGGQPHDTGKLITHDGEFTVIFVGKFRGEISHEINTSIKSERKLEVGDKIRGIIDWKRRYKLMRMHTAAHIISAIFSKKGRSLLITGNQLDTEKSRIDFNLEDFDRDKIQDYVEEANRVVEGNRKIKIYSLPREEAEKIPDLTKLAKGLPDSIKDIRIVEIDGVDLQADGGTHVKSTGEVGKIKILKLENKGKNNRRIYFTLE